MIDTPVRELHAFFYLWYGNPETDGKYIHWNHRILPHWQEQVTKLYPTGNYQPPGNNKQIASRVQTNE